MASEYSFSVMPSVSISRSRFNRKSQHKTSFNLGQIIPIYCDEVLPGDTRTFDMATLVRMSTPIAPIMDNIYMDIYAFFVPNRLTWNHWKEFMGENSVSAGIPSSTYSIPTLYSGTSADSAASGSYCDYFGLPVGVSGIFTQDKISALPFRSLCLIYNRWFRNENVIAPLAVQTGDTNEVIVGDLAGTRNNFMRDASNILKASKLPDYFTKSLPYAQKGTAVSIPLGASAPVTAAVQNGTTMGGTGSIDAAFGAVSLNPSTQSMVFHGVDSTNTPVTGSGKLIADLSSATAATINELRYAFQLQKLLEKDALYGTKYSGSCKLASGAVTPK